MRVTILKNNPKVYSCNVYYIRGDWNKIDDVNTMIDVGTDGFVIDELETISAGVGKKRVDQIIITHEHFDHAGGLKRFRELYHPKVYSHTKLDHSDLYIADGAKIQIGDREAVVMHTPGHSNDSICIYCEEEQVLFSGDTALSIKTPGGTYTMEFVDVLERLAALKIKTIYSGHDSPVTKNANEIILNTLRNVRRSRLIS